MVVIEFFGAPGVGKSFWLGELTKRCASDGRCELRSSIRGEQRSSPARALAKLSGAVVEVAFSRDSRSLAQKIFNLPGVGVGRATRLAINACWIRHTIRRAARRGLILLDQGLAQILWSVSWSCPNGGRITWEDLVSGLNSTFYVVHIRQDERLVASRIAGRVGGKSPLDEGFVRPGQVAQACHIASVVVRRLKEQSSPELQISDFDAGQNRDEGVNELLRIAMTSVAVR